MLKIILLIASVFVIGTFAYDSYADHPSNICPVNPPKDCHIGHDANAVPHLSGLQSCEDYTFTGVLEQPVCGRTNSELFIHNGMALTDTVCVIYKGLLIDCIDIGATPTGEPHNEWIGIGGQRMNIPSWAYYENAKEGNLLNKGEGYQHVSYDLAGGKYWTDPEKTYERTLAYAKYQAIIYRASNG